MSLQIPSAIRVLAGVCFVFSTPVIAPACMWEYGTDPHGRPHEYSGRMGHIVEQLKSNRKPSSEWDARRIELEAKLPGGDYKVRNDYAVALAHLGRYKEALEILKKIEAEHPGKYVTAANMGTVYELLGDNEQALKWIKEGIKRNPRSHNGTEWVHVKILEAKLALAKDPDWLKTHSVLGLDFGNDLVPKKPAKPDDVHYAILYQLQERLQFVTEPPDPIVADLLADLGNVIAATGPIESAIPVYRFALEFQPVRADLVKQRLAHFEELVRQNPVSGAPAQDVWLWGGLIAAAGLACVLVIAFQAIRRRRRTAGGTT